MVLDPLVPEGRLPTVKGAGADGQGPSSTAWIDCGDNTLCITESGKGCKVWAVTLGGLVTSTAHPGVGMGPLGSPEPGVQQVLSTADEGR